MGTKEIRIAGFGGQGVVLSGLILGQAASIYDDGFSALTQSYGPEARGGSCTAEVVISDEPIGYPYVQSPNVLIILSQEAYNKYSQDLPARALMIIDPDLVKPEPSQNPAPLSIPATRMARDMGRTVVANIIILGFLAAVSDLISPEALKNSVLASVPKGTEEFNTKAFELGYNYGLEHGRKGEVADG
ncbi:MAG: 2-oxoacid:acceptor oxidoreductase family protein [Dehalococcoidia bacterium]|nr:2-oxoacid:acceptor oxidoreductase family protein [Dehalococcoidia bacterium]